MSHPIHIVDAFATRPFTGNPAAVVLFDRYPEDAVLQAIAAQNNLAETAYPVLRTDGKWDLRWFTPAIEVPLCGHATLASAFVLFREVLPGTKAITFVTRQSGELRVTRGDGGLAMDFPAYTYERSDDDLPGLDGAEVQANDRFIMAVLPDAGAVRGFVPDFAAIARLGRPLIVTAPGDGDHDCVSRFFAPADGIDEDPVTGSAHCLIAPYWAERLGKDTIRAWQASPRGGAILCRVGGGRVELSGDCVPYLSGTIAVP